MNSVFFRASAFNADLSKWNVSIVNSMFAMFSEAISFNADLAGWDVSSMTNIELIV